MYLNLNIQPHQLQQISDFLAPLDNLRTNFKILTAGKDTYIVNATVETGVNFDDDIYSSGGCYSLQVGSYSALAENILFLVNMNHDYLSVAQGGICCLPRKIQKIDKQNTKNKPPKVRKSAAALLNKWHCKAKYLS